MKEILLALIGFLSIYAEIAFSLEPDQSGVESFYDGAFLRKTTISPFLISFEYKKVTPPLVRDTELANEVAELWRLH